MAASSGSNDGRRSSGRASSSSSSGKTDKQSRKTNGDESDKICGFHPLRSLRNIFFGYRTRWRQSVDEVHNAAVAVETPPATKAKSTDDIPHHHQQQQQQDHHDDRTKAVVHTPVANTNNANPSNRLSRPSAIPLVNKQLSKSADNLASPSDWIPAPHGIPSAVNSPSSGSDDSNLNASMGEIDDSAVLDPNSVDEFFTDNWSQACSSRTRAFSSGDAERVNEELTFDLDSVDQTKALDVSAAKNRIAIKPTNKRLTVAMQQKMLRAETTPRPAKTYHLPSLTEAGEDGDGGAKKERKTTDASDTAAAAADAEAPPDRPLRREKRPNIPAPDKSGRMTISITPDMLAGARKKASDRGGPGGLGGPGGAGGGNPSIVVQTSTANPSRPPPPTCPKKRKTFCEPAAGGVSSELLPHEEKKKEELGGEASAQNGAASAISVPMRPAPLLSVKEDDALTGGEEEDAAARPKAPPRVRPKPRPKTMMHAAAGGTKTTEAEPEWVTNRANKKKNDMVD